MARKEQLTNYEQEYDENTPKKFKKVRKICSCFEACALEADFGFSGVSSLKLKTFEYKDFT